MWLFLSQVSMSKYHSVSAVEHWTASEARKNREIAIRKDEREKVLDKLIQEIESVKQSDICDQYFVWYKDFEYVVEQLRQVEP